MTQSFVEKTPDEKAQIAIRTAMDSVNLVNQLVTAGEHTEQIDRRVEANYKHLEIVIARENVISYVSNNSVDISALNSAIATGKTFLGQ
jgi:hypothetical protein